MAARIRTRLARASVAFGLLFATLAASAHEIQLAAGRTSILKLGDVQRVSIGNAELLDATVINETQELLLIAKQPGVTDVRVWLDGKKPRLLTIVIHDPAIESLRYAMQQHARDMPGVEARIIGDRVVFEGSVESAQDASRIEEIAKAYEAVDAFISKDPFDLQQMIYMQVRFLEVRKNVLKEIGVDWQDVADGFSFGAIRDFVSNDLYRNTQIPGGGGFPARARVGPEGFFGYSTRLDSVFRLLDENGLARLLAEPQLGALNGGEAKFLAGGEVPIPVINQQGAVNVLYKEYGVILDIAPLADRRGNVRTDIKVEVSSIDNTVDVLGIPGFLVRRSTSQINLKADQTLILAGLVNSSQAKDVDRLPGLGNIPILGELFKSRAFINEETDLIVLVTPVLEDGRVSKKASDRYDELNSGADETLKFSIWD